MQIPFCRWCLDPKGRTPLSVNPARVDCVEHYSDGVGSNPAEITGELDYPHWERDSIPAASRIIMQGKQVYLVQGSVKEIVAYLNASQKLYPPSER